MTTILDLIDRGVASSDQEDRRETVECLQTAFRLAALTDWSEELAVGRAMSLAANRLAHLLEAERKIDSALEWTGRSMSANACILSIAPNDSRASRNLRENYINLGLLCESRTHDDGLTPFERSRYRAEARLWYRRAAAQDRVLPRDSSSRWTIDAVRAREAACDRYLATAEGSHA